VQRDIEFDAEGVTLRGWLVTPDHGSGPFPTIIMSHGISCVKEMYLDDFARVFAEAGFACVVYDNRCFGASDGEPRQELDPWAQVRDYRHACTYAETLDVVDNDRIGFWGVSYGGGNVIVAAALDRRCKCVVSLIPMVSGYRQVRRFLPAHLLPMIRAAFDADRRARFRGEPARMIPMVSEQPFDPYVVLPQQESYDFFTSTHRERAPAWRNELTLRSAEMTSEYEAGAFIDRVSPTPLQMIVMQNDLVTLADDAIEFYERALEPKKLVLVPGNHYEAYRERFAETSAASRDWFVTHLRGS
jgi:dienelactone hydrolase